MYYDIILNNEDMRISNLSFDMKTIRFYSMPEYRHKSLWKYSNVRIIYSKEMKCVYVIKCGCGCITEYDKVPGSAQRQYI